jgi:uncharacterized protein
VLAHGHVMADPTANATVHMPVARRVASLARRAAHVLAAAGWAALAAEPATALDSTLISIATGGRTGVYYLAGGVICDLLNEGRWEHGIRCMARQSNGSIDNLREVRRGEGTFGIVQSDWQHHAVRGTDVFEAAGPDRELRSVFSLFPEPFTVVAHPESGIAGLADLRGKRVDLGPAGSGGRATMGVVLERMGWTEADFAFASDLPMGALSRALCAGEIDAAVFIVAHPNLTVEDMVTSCDAVLVPVAGPAIDGLVDENAYYFPSEIPAGTYPDKRTATPTFALGATLVTASRTPPRIVHALTRAVFENFEAFRDAHPAFAGLEEAEMTTEGLTAPLHEGALRYFEETGLR